MYKATPPPDWQLEPEASASKNPCAAIAPSTEMQDIQTVLAKPVDEGNVTRLAASSSATLAVPTPSDDTWTLAWPPSSEAVHANTCVVVIASLTLRSDALGSVTSTLCLVRFVSWLPWAIVNTYSAPHACAAHRDPVATAVATSPLPELQIADAFTSERLTSTEASGCEKTATPSPVGKSTVSPSSDSWPAK